MNRVTDNLESTTKEEVESRIQHLDELYAKFQTNAQQISTIIPEEEYAKDLSEETEIEDRYFAIRAALSQCLERLKPPQASTSGSEGQASDSTLAQVLEQQVSYAAAVRTFEQY